MEIKDLNDQQIRQLYCSAMDWHIGLNRDETTVSIFDKFYDEIKYEWSDGRWTIVGEYAQIEITEDLYIRVGSKYNAWGIGGTLFNLLGVYKCLKEFGIFDPKTVTIKH